jgi:hypothetical protein
MSDQAAPEPTMEEILASIRRIISEDDAPGGETEAAAHEAEPVMLDPEPEPEPEPEEPAEDILELTERVEPPKESVGDIDAYAKREPVAEPEPPKQEPVSVREEEESIVSPPSAYAAASAFGHLSAAVAMPAPGRTLEDLVRELLKPLLKEWLDQHLPQIVEQKVAEEVERIARRVR